MHGFIRDRLEDLLSASSSAVKDREVAVHLSSCRECSSELKLMKEQAALFRTLRAPDDAEPVGGFYARVMQRIEDQGAQSIWSVFIYSPFAKRLLYGSLTAAMMLGTYVVTEESREGNPDSPVAVVQSAHYDAPVFGSQAEQRDAVLENFAAHSSATSHRVAVH
jgi:hypothetical protein